MIGILAQADVVTLSFWTAVLAAGVRLAVSVGTAAIGEMINERAGVLNLGLEGVMLLGGFAGFAASFESGSPWVGLAGGLAAGALVGAAFAALVVVLRVDQVVAGLGLTLFGIAFTAFLNREIYGGGSSPPRTPRPGDVEIPVLADIPLIGDALFAQNAVAYVAIGVVVVAAVVLRRSYWRIVVDAAGEAPYAADAAGHSVTFVRFLATVVGCSLGGFAGAVLIVGQLGFFNTNITAGRGWIALALVIFGRWRPLWIAAGAVFFGALDALQFRFQTLDSAVPFEFFIALPFVVTLIALCVGGRSAAAPSALGPAIRTVISLGTVSGACRFLLAELTVRDPRNRIPPQAGWWWSYAGIMFSRKVYDVNRGGALPGREEAMRVPDAHAVLGTPLTPPWPDGMETAVFALGCFWGAEKLFWQVPGVYTTAVGYAGGSTPNPTYEEVCSGRTGHAEAVLVVFDPAVVGYDQLLKLFWEDHDPTQGMRQGNDVGSQYRSAIYLTDGDQRELAEASRTAMAGALAEAGYGEITTEFADLDTFYYAEPYHQQYLEKNPNGYCPIHATGVSCRV